jgi:hypothetical protein
MADRVKLVVWYPTIDRSLCVESEVFVFVYVDPGTANVTGTISDISVLNRGRKRQVAQVGLVEMKTAPPPYQKVYRVVNLAPRKTARLIITASVDGGALEPEKVVRLLSCRAKTHGFFETSVTISVPPPPGGEATATDVDSDFLACGFVDPSSAEMSAWVVPDSGRSVGGIRIDPPPQPYDWAFGFSLAAGLATLYVQGVSGGIPDLQTRRINVPQPPDHTSPRP